MLSEALQHCNAARRIPHYSPALRVLFGLRLQAISARFCRVWHSRAESNRHVCHRSPKVPTSTTYLLQKCALQAATAAAAMRTSTASGQAPGVGVIVAIVEGLQALSAHCWQRRLFHMRQQASGASAAALQSHPCKPILCAGTGARRGGRCSGRRGAPSARRACGATACARPRS